jgi:hypothetical protein
MMKARVLTVARTTWLALAIVSIPAVRAVAQGGTAPRLPAAIEAEVNRIADSARTRGLPTDPLYAKAAEGSLKGAEGARIVDAVRRLARELGTAHDAIGSEATSAELVAAASSLHAGVTPAQLTQLARSAGDRGAQGRLVMPFVVLADLVARHVTADVAVSTIQSLVARNAPDAQFSTLRAAIERDIASGERPDAAAQVRSAAVLRTLEPRPTPRPPE